MANIKNLFGTSWIGSINRITIPERSAISDRYTLGRSVGVELQGKYQRLFYTVGVFEDILTESERNAQYLASGVFQGVKPIT